MKLYIARPAQAGTDGTLTETGRAQAEALGRRLVCLGFRGRVLYVPHPPAMETAGALANAVGAEAEAPAFLAAGFPEDTAKLEEYLALCGEDVLIVAAGSFFSAARRFFRFEHFRSVTGWDAALSCLDTESRESYVTDVSFLPEALRTAGNFTWAAAERACEKTVAAAETFFAASAGERVLHIGDTYSYHYEFYRRLLAATKPHVVIHTGDVADEWKAGRIAADVPVWERAAGKLLGILKESGARVILVPGNNDVPAFLEKRADFAEIYPPTTVISLGGKRICLAHSVHQLKVEAEIYLYGHGLSGESRTREENAVDGRLYFNDSWGTSLHDLEGGRHLIVDNPRF